MQHTQTADIIIVGGGAAGFFAAVNCARLNPKLKVVLLEKSARFLAKVEISGGGRCNVTHHCFDAKELVMHYPRGQRELLGPFMRFQPADTVKWFESRGVPLKTEADGRMFPASNSSSSIINCLMEEARRYAVQLHTRCGVKKLEPASGVYNLLLDDGTNWQAPQVMLACGGFPRKEQFDFIAALNLQIVDPVPSLFTFVVQDKKLAELAGISVQQASIQIKGRKESRGGPLLITHRGLSGPAILKTSAFAARELAEQNYRFTLLVNWLGTWDEETCRTYLLAQKEEQAKKKIINCNPTQLPARLWEYLLQRAGIGSEQRWADMSRVQMQQLLQALHACAFDVTGKNTFKDEFVTAGGIDRREIDFKTMELKKWKGLHVAGEIADIDAVTGGFNFQAAWTTAFIAATHMAGAGQDSI